MGYQYTKKRIAAILSKNGGYITVAAIGGWGLGAQLGGFTGAFIGAAIGALVGANAKF